MRKQGYKSTFVACFVSIANQAIISNLTAILFVPFMKLYGFEIWQLGVLIGINFGAQMVADVILSFIIDKTPFRPIVVIAVAVSAIGLLFFGFVPFIFKPSFIYFGLILATIVFAFSGGMLEVVVSPIIDNIPNVPGKGAAMSLMHSFYAWGQVITIVVTTLFLVLFGDENWNYILFFWTIVPVAAMIIFFFCPLEKKVVTEKVGTKNIFSKFFIVAVIAIMFGGASEVIMNQWVSTYLQVTLGFAKMTADLLGMCLFAVCLGLGRTLYGILGNKFDLHKVLIIGAAITFLLYLLAGLSPSPILALIACVLCGFTSSLLWPGTLVISSNKFPLCGAWIFAVLAISGDIGASFMPVIAGFAGNNFGINYALVIMSVVPLVAFFAHVYLFYNGKNKKLLDNQDLSKK